MSPAIKELLQQVASWPHEDQEELADVARDIEAACACWQDYKRRKRSRR